MNTSTFRSNPERQITKFDDIGALPQSLGDLVDSVRPGGCRKMASCEAAQSILIIAWHMLTTLP